MPRVISAEVPSGKTSQSFTESEAAGRRRDVERDRRLADDRADRLRRHHSHVSERASSSRWSPESPHGRWPAQSIQAAVPTSGSTASERSPVDLERQRRRRGDRPRPGHPEPLVQLEVGLGDRRGADEDVGPVRPLVGARPAQPAVPPRDHLVVEVDPRPGDRGGRVGVRPRPGQQPPRRAGLAQRRRRSGRCCCGSRRPSPPRSSWGTGSGRSRRWRREPACQ